MNLRHNKIQESPLTETDRPKFEYPKIKQENAKDNFLKMFNSLPEKARSELVFDFVSHPMTLNVCKLEVENDTKLGRDILERLGYNKGSRSDE